VGRPALKLAFFVLGFSFMLLKINELFSLGTPLVFAASLLLPAAVLGGLVWWSVDSFARNWPVVLCAGIGAVGMLYANVEDNRRGLAAATYLILVLPIATLIVKHRCWWLCAKVYVLANASALAWALWLEYWQFGIMVFFVNRRFGFLWSSILQMRLGNPNMIGIQLGFAAVLAFALYLKESGRPGDVPDAPRRSGSLMLACTAFLILGCMLTASRGAFAAMAAGLITLFLFETKGQMPGRLKCLVATVLVMASLMAFVVVWRDFRPWRTLASRMGSATSVLTAAGRVHLWTKAYNVWRSNPRTFWIGTGTGAAPEALSVANRFTTMDGTAIRAIDTHNVFCEWVLSYGALGLVAGVPLVYTVVRTAGRLDRRDGRVTRRAILLCFFLASLNLVTFYDLFFVPAGSLILAMLSDPRALPGSWPPHPEPEPAGGLAT
jgi:hypothetical protein